VGILQHDVFHGWSEKQQRKHNFQLEFDTHAKSPRTDNEVPCPSFPEESEISGESPSTRVEKNKDCTPKSTLRVKFVQSMETRFGCKIDS